MAETSPLSGFSSTRSSQKIARRSISIFSRRGTETPVQTTMPFDSTTARAPVKMTERQRAWSRRFSRGVAKQPDGTILHAVPPTETIPAMTPLEEAMATSPNEEILNAISQHPPSPQTYQSYLPLQSNLWNQSTSSMTAPTERRRDTDNRIGVWRDGVAHWDARVQQGLDMPEQPRSFSIVADTGYVAYSPPAISPAEARSRYRPNLSITIPPPRQPNKIHPALRQPTRPSHTVAPANVVSKFNINSREEEDDVVSPMSHALAGPKINTHENTTPVVHVASPGAQPSIPELLRPGPSRSSSSSSTVPLASGDMDDASCYSKRSSMTSLEAEPECVADPSIKPPQWNHLYVPKRTSSAAFSITSPVQAGVFDEPTPATPTDLNKPLPPSPIPTPARAAPTAPADSNPKFRAAKQLRNNPSRRSVPDISRRERPVSQKTCRSLSALDMFDEEFRRTDPNMPEPSSPTLSEAVDELHAQLGTISEDAPLQQAESHAQQLAVDFLIPQVPSRAPTLPKKSRKRQWRASSLTPHVAELAWSKPDKQPSRRSSAPMMRAEVLPELEVSLPVSRLRKTSSANAMPKMIEFAEMLRSSWQSQKSVVIPTITIDDGLIVVDGPSFEASPAETQAVVRSPAEAESVLLWIMSALDNLDDLFATSMINKGMRHVYEENEMSLLRTVYKNMSSAAWEFREWTPVSEAEEDELLKHTPKTFVQAHRHDERTIRAVKALVLERCQSYLRADTVLALSETSGPEAQRFTDALYRIWCFCKIFGCEKGREDDITGQIDWLKGGVLAHQDNCVATVNTNLEFDMSSVLLNAPDHFAKGNAGGLSTEQLYDIIELWNCLSALLQGYQGRTEQARKAGIFDHADVPEGDVEKEDAVVEEWLSYVLTLGLPTILQLARLSTDQSDAGFALAKARRWADWTPLTAPSTRSTFLKEPVARLYEERTATRLLKSQDPRSVAKKEMSRRRVASLAAEIKLARNASGYKRLPLIDMATERPMSVLSRRDSVASSSFSSSHFPSHPPSHFASPAASPPMSSSSASASSFSSSFAPAPRRATDPAINVYVNGRPMSPTWQSPRRVSPIIEDRVETFNRMSMQSFNGVAEDTSERAVRKIVEMGFSAAEAREALRMTDMGDGLRVDRAVDLLIRKV